MKKFVAMLVLFTSTAYAEKQVYGSWGAEVFEYGGGFASYANTSNDSGSILGVLCTSQSAECEPYLVNGLACDEDEIYPALVGIDDGITSVNMGCVHLNEYYLYTLPAEHLEYIVTMNQYSIAFGVEGGRFKAAYFSLDGSAKAVIAAKTLIANKTKSNDRKVKSKRFDDEIL